MRLGLSVPCRANHGGGGEEGGDCLGRERAREAATVGLEIHMPSVVEQPMQVAGRSHLPNNLAVGHKADTVPPREVDGADTAAHQRRLR